MSAEYKYSSLDKPLSFTKHSAAEQVNAEPNYEQAEMPTEAVYTQTPCIP